ncbi:hypothetical protein [Dactylosporangium cerinum]
MNNHLTGNYKLATGPAAVASTAVTALNPRSGVEERAHRREDEGAERPDFARPPAARPPTVTGWPEER